MILTVFPSGINHLHTKVNKSIYWEQWKLTALNPEETEKVLKQINKINQG